MKKRLAMLVLTAACLMAGFGFYRMNDNNLILAGAFTVGILGILLSVVRNWK